MTKIQYVGRDGGTHMPLGRWAAGLKWHALAALLAGALLSGLAHAQLNSNERATGALGKAWGFFYGQMARLDRIEQSHPDLRAGVFQARSELRAAFPDLEAQAEKSFRSWGATDEQLTKMRQHLRDGLAPMLAQEPNDREAALAFLGAVRQRAKGVDVPEDILQYLLAAAFMDRPHVEVLRGWRKDYSSRGHPKAKGIEVRLKVPRSFKQEEGERPNIVAKWTSEGGNGLEMMMLTVLTGGDYTLSRQEIDDDLRLGARSEIRGALEEVGQVLSLRSFSQERAAGYIADVESQADRAGIEMTIRQRMFVLFVKNRVVSFSCQIGTTRDRAPTLESRMAKFGELCRLTVNSLVLPQQYSGGG